MAESSAHEPAPYPLPAGWGPLTLPAAADFRLRRWAIEGYPEERCGVLVGREARDATHVHRVIRLDNVSPARRHDRYVLDPDGFLRADATARAERLEIVGFWHTHPDHPARPSLTDLEQAWEDYTYLIVSVEGAGATTADAERRDRGLGVTRATAWRLRDGAFHPQALWFEPTRADHEATNREAGR